MMKNYSYSRTWLLAPLILSLMLMLVVAFYFMWWHLPVSVNRYSDIKKGNLLIEKTEAYAAKHGLPQTNDWHTLQQLGYELRSDLLIPDYQKINDTTFELMYLEGFDGPYLLWNSRERQWRMGYSSRFR